MKIKHKSIINSAIIYFLATKQRKNKIFYIGNKKEIFENENTHEVH